MNYSLGSRLCLLALAWAMLAVFAPGANAQPTPPSTLAGETFNAIDGITGVVTISCGATETSPFTYHAEGDAVGPHMGRFVEDGRVVPDATTGLLVSLDATFTIIEASGTIDGEKHRVGPLGPGPLALCNRLDEEFINVSSEQLCYHARFPDGSSETGRSSLRLGAEAGFPARFSEDFTPDPTVTCAPACPPNDDEDNDGLTDTNESLFFTLLGNDDSDFDGIPDGNDDANGNGEDDEDEDDDEDDGCPDEDSDGDGTDDEDEDDGEDD